MKNLDETIQERNQTLEDLSKRFSSINLQSSPVKSPQRPTNQYITFGTPTAKSSPAKRVPLHVPAAVLADVKSAINDDPISNPGDHLQGRKTRLTKASSTVRSNLFSQGTKQAVRIDEIPQPKPLPSDPEPKRKSTAASTESPSQNEDAQPPGPSPASPSPFSAFSGITFSLDPGPIATSLPRSAGGSNRGFGSNRQHAPAARLDLTTSSAGSSQAAAGGFDFSLPSPQNVPAKKDGSPSGFFSLSGYTAR